MKPKDERLDKIDVVRVEDRKVYVLGRKDSPEFFLSSPGISDERLYEICHDANTGEILEESSFRKFNVSPLLFGFLSYVFEDHLSLRERYRRTKQYCDKVLMYLNKNTEDVRKVVGSMPVYQGTIDEVAREVGRPLELIDTGKPNKFVSGEDLLWLRAAAHLLGADAIVHYQPGSSIGTPVKYA